MKLVEGPVLLDPVIHGLARRRARGKLARERERDLVGVVVVQVPKRDILRSPVGLVRGRPSSCCCWSLFSSIFTHRSGGVSGGGPRDGEVVLEDGADEVDEPWEPFLRIPEHFVLLDHVDHCVLHVLFLGHLRSRAHVTLPEEDLEEKAGE